MKARKPALKFCFIAFLAIVLLVTWAWRASIAFDLSHAYSATIKNDQGQPAELWWWLPRQAPPIVKYPSEFANPEDKDFADQHGEILLGPWLEYGLTNRWNKVAVIATRPNRINVYVLSPRERRHQRVFAAYSSELTKKRPFWSWPWIGG